MSSQVWVGAVATVVGVAIGGGISYLSNRQQMREARTQRLEEARREQYRRSMDRRFQAYSDFLTRVRSCRNVVRDYLLLSDHRPNVGDIDALVRSANDASAMVFLVVESEKTHEACRAVLSALGRATEAVHGLGSSSIEHPWPMLNEAIGRTTREFQIAAREELGVSGVEQQWIEYRAVPDDKPESGAN